MKYSFLKMSRMKGPAYRSHPRKGAGLRYRMSWNLSLQMSAISQPHDQQSFTKGSKTLSSGLPVL